ncbi:MAG: ATP-binding protein [Desulforegulaceae bacterium]|nr:ATP-binding protein [Desulforegulaceae bacterium]
MEEKKTALPKDYEGRLLFQDISLDLKKSLCSYINRLQSINELLVPAILYISAWKDGKNEIWYEYAGDNFKDLFSSDIKNLSSVFKNSVKARKTYVQKESNLTIQTQDKPLLLKKILKLRNETENSGFNEAVYKIEYRNNIFWLKDQARVIPFTKDKVTISIGNLTNVTKEMEADEARKKAEIILKNKEEILTSLFNNSYDSVILTDIEGNIIDCNEVAERTFNYTKNELINKKYYSFILPQERKTSINKIKEVMGKKNIRTELTLLTKDKKTLEVEVSIVRIDSNPLVIQSFIRKNSEKIALEKEKIATSKFKLVSTMATGISHDINNILSIIHGNLSLAAMEASKNNNENILKIIERINKASSHLELITKKFFSFSDTSLIIKNSIEIKSFFNKYVDKYKDLTLTIKIADNLKYFRINPLIFEPAIDAIIENSSEAIANSKHKEIKIKISDLTIKEDSDLKEKLFKEENYIKIEIIDSGKGIKPDNISRMFDPYFSTKPLSSKKGTGLGLSNVYTAIKQHEGYIEVESKENIMTKFIVYIPE